MMFTPLVVLAGLAALAQAQDASIPPCATSCLTIKIQEVNSGRIVLEPGVNASNFTSLCTSQVLRTAYLNCVNDNCPPANLTAATNIAASVCESGASSIAGASSSVAGAVSSASSAVEGIASSASTAIVGIASSVSSQQAAASSQIASAQSSFSSYVASVANTTATVTDAAAIASIQSGLAAQSTSLAAFESSVQSSISSVAAAAANQTAQVGASATSQIASATGNVGNPAASTQPGGATGLRVQSGLLAAVLGLVFTL